MILCTAELGYNVSHAISSSVIMLIKVSHIMLRPCSLMLVSHTVRVNDLSGSYTLCPLRCVERNVDVYSETIYHLVVLCVACHHVSWKFLCSSQELHTSHSLRIPRPALEITHKTLSHIDNPLDMSHVQRHSLIDRQCLSCSHQILDLPAIDITLR